MKSKAWAVNVMLRLMDPSCRRRPDATEVQEAKEILGFGPGALCAGPTPRHELMQSRAA